MPTRPSTTTTKTGTVIVVDAIESYTILWMQPTRLFLRHLILSSMLGLEVFWVIILGFWCYSLTRRWTIRNLPSCLRGISWRDILSCCILSSNSFLRRLLAVMWRSINLIASNCSDSLSTSLEYLSLYTETFGLVEAHVGSAQRQNSQQILRRTHSYPTQPTDPGLEKLLWGVGLHIE